MLRAAAEALATGTLSGRAEQETRGTGGLHASGTVPGTGTVAREFRPLLGQPRTPSRKTGWHACHGGRPAARSEHGFEPLRNVVEQALAMGVSDVATIRYLLELERSEKRVPAEALDVGWLARYERPQPTLYGSSPKSVIEDEAFLVQRLASEVAGLNPRFI